MSNPEPQPVPQELKEEFKKLWRRDIILSGRVAVLEDVIVRAAKRLRPPNFHEWREEIKSLNPSDFTGDIPGPTALDRHAGAAMQIDRLKELIK